MSAAVKTAMNKASITLKIAKAAQKTAQSEENAAAVTVAEETLTAATTTWREAVAAEATAK